MKSPLKKQIKLRSNIFQSQFIMTAVTVRPIPRLLTATNKQSFIFGKFNHIGSFVCCFMRSIAKWPVGGEAAHAKCLALPCLYHHYKWFCLPSGHIFLPLIVWETVKLIFCSITSTWKFYPAVGVCLSTAIRARNDIFIYTGTVNINTAGKLSGWPLYSFIKTNLSLYRRAKPYTRQLQQVFFLITKRKKWLRKKYMSASILKMTAP